MRSIKLRYCGNATCSFNFEGPKSFPAGFLELRAEAYGALARGLCHPHTIPNSRTTTCHLTSQDDRLPIAEDARKPSLNFLNSASARVCDQSPAS